MTSYAIHYNIPTGSFQRPVRTHEEQKEANKPHPVNIKEQSPPPKPFFLQRSVISKELASRLIPVDVDLHTKKNTEEHSTNHYDIPGLVLRRGQPFSFTLTFNRDFDASENQLFVRLAIGSRSMISKGTQIRLLVDGTPSGSGWSAKNIPTEEKRNDENKKNNRVSLQINSPSDAIIGKYTILLEVRPKKKDDDKDATKKREVSLFLFEIDVYFLVNPWNKEDACALPLEQISEYVMNEHGQIYLGSAKKPQQIPWYFGQFESSALLSAFDLLDKSHLPAQNRSDPSVVLRILSSKICSNPGTNSGIFPSSFDARGASSENSGHTSSSAVLKEYLSSNGRSIQGGSGSNWQHAAVLCSLSRALGIPCRIVTVYDAACRADGLENNDIHWDTEQRPLKQLNADLICSSHVWNECWMGRKDLANNVQDWQVVDSTPVLMCDGIRRTGPCSVSSLKKGDLGFRWDSPFVHSSIHGNKFHWLVHPDGDMELLDVQENTIGTKIITRSLENEFELEDITGHYKNATHSSDAKDSVAARSKNDVDIEIKLPKDIQFGEDIILELNAKNKSNEIRTITTALTISITNNTGQKSLYTHDQPIQTLKLESEKDGITQLKISPQQYGNYGKQENINLKYYIHAKVKETDQTFTRDDNVVFTQVDLIKPDLEEDVIEIGKPILLRLQIANTLSRPLSGGRIHIDGFGINQILPVNRSFAPKESASLQIKLYPRRVGVGRLYVTFISNNMTSLAQSIPLEILSGPLEKQHEPLLKSESEKATQKKDDTQVKDDSQKSPQTDEVAKGKDDSQKVPLTASTAEAKNDLQKPPPAGDAAEAKDDLQIPPQTGEATKGKDDSQKPLAAGEPAKGKDDSKEATAVGEAAKGKDDSQKATAAGDPAKGKDDSQKPPQTGEKSEAKGEAEKSLETNKTSEVTTDANKKTETGAQHPEKPTSSPSNLSDEQEKGSSNASPTKSVSPSSENVNTGGSLAEPQVKNTASPPQANTNTNAPIPSGSTLSLDKDKMSVDSLDISSDSRQIPNNNPSPNQS